MLMLVARVLRASDGELTILPTMQFGQLRKAAFMRKAYSLLPALIRSLSKFLTHMSAGFRQLIAESINIVWVQLFGEKPMRKQYLEAAGVILRDLYLP